MLHAIPRTAVRLDSQGLGSVSREHKNKNNMVSAHQRKGGLSFVAMEMQNGASTLEGSLVVSYKTRHTLTI